MMKRAYQTLLRLYPTDYRVLFGAEMSSTFVKAAEESRSQGRLRFVHFVFAELIGLLSGAATEWISKRTTDKSVRGRHLPDLRMMRPPGVSQRLWFAAACTSVGTASLQDDVVEVEKRIEIIIGDMVHAIANHDFPKARFYSDQEREAREHLGHLQQRHSVRGCSATMPPSD